MMTAQEIRTQFMEFFESKSHKVVGSAPIVIKDDPTLMFTNAGMNQFKDYFLGDKLAESKRVADTQKCLRVSGKHNDLEEVGFDTYHHTMFEMLGNWSFGDYFKKEAIEWAWELLTEVYKLPKDRLYVTIFEGDKSEKLERDNEAYEEWTKWTTEENILNGNKKDNFWEMGATGPCGPCSEIHIDLRSSEEFAKVDGKTLVNEDHPQVVEVWNLVFMQYNRKANGQLENLPETHVDTGMGFERLCMAIQGKESNYDTDVFTPLIDQLAESCNKKYGDDLKVDIALRVIADHVRAVSFAIADGQLPSNNKAGYVIRRILRRAVRYGYTFLGFNHPFMHSLVPLLSTQFKDVFPELVGQVDLVEKVIKEEENSFLRTLENGLKKLDTLTQGGNKTIDGSTAFELFDTYGFPLDLTELIARENSMSVDIEGFNSEMEQQKTRSRADSQRTVGDWEVLLEDDKEEFVGYDNLECDVKITRYRKVVEKGKELFHLALNITPFYPEGGGQVGDVGVLEIADEKTYVKNTVKENDLILHVVEKLPEHFHSILRAKVNVEKRNLSANNHSATHLLHAALKQVLGTHVQQKGSLVNEKHLRFDFSHFSKVTDEELTKIENIVNDKVRSAIKLDEQRDVPANKAINELGATALFGEKYGDTVRVITFDNDYSVELCGGTHVKNTSEIGLFKLTHETAVAAGVRRIEAITSVRAQEFLNNELNTLNEVRGLLKNPKNITAAVAQIMNENTLLRKKVEKLENAQAGDLKGDLMKSKVERDGMNVIIKKVSLPNAQVLKQLAFDLRKDIENLYLVLAVDVAGKPQVCVMLADSLVANGLNANPIIKELSKEIKGGGGGQPFFATAGGKDLSGLDRVVEVAEKMIEEVNG